MRRLPTGKMMRRRGVHIGRERRGVLVARRTKKIGAKEEAEAKRDLIREDKR